MKADVRDVTVQLSDQLDEVTSALERLTELLEREDDLGPILDGVCAQVIVAIPDADMASLTVLHGGRAETVAYTDERVLAIDAAQYQAGKGPCLEAAATGEVVRVDIEDAAELWPDFTRDALGIGVASYLSVPLTVEEACAGAVNLYSYRRHSFVELDAALLELFAIAVDNALRNTRRYLATRALADDLKNALISRSVIDQAKGVLMAVHGIDADEAFVLLANRSQHENVKVRTVAERVVAVAAKGAAAS